jgi:hypothetical protein
MGENSSSKRSLFYKYKPENGGTRRGYYKLTWRSRKCNSRNV